VPQQEFNPVPGVSTNADCEDVINNNATDAEERLATLEGGAESIPSLYVVTSADAGKFLTYDSASDTSFNINSSDGLSPGQVVEIQQKGTGAIEYVGLPGVSISSPRFTGSNPRSSGRGAVIRIRCITSDSYSITGDLKEERPLVVTFFEEGQQRSTGDYLTFTATGGMQLKGGFTLQSNDRFTIPVDGFYRVTFSIYVRNANSGFGDPNLTAILFRNITSGTEVFRVVTARFSADIADYTAGTQTGVQYFTAGTQIGFEDPDLDDLTFINDSDRMPVSVEWISD